MKNFDIKDFADQLPNFGYIEVRLLPTNSTPRLDLEVAAQQMLKMFNSTKHYAMKHMVPQFFDILITDQDCVVNTKMSINVNPQNSTSASMHLLRIQVDSNSMPMVDSFRNLPDDVLMSMFSHALGLLVPAQE